MKGEESKLFNSIKTKGEGLYDNIHIYGIEGGNADEAFRVDCGELGSFEVFKYMDSEEYNTKTDEWDIIEGVWFSFISCDGHCDEYPVITIDQALKIFSKPLVRKGLLN